MIQPCCSGIVPHFTRPPFFFLSSPQSESQNISSASSAAHERPRSPFLALRKHTHDLKSGKTQSRVSKQVGKINDSTFHAKNTRHQNAGKTDREISWVNSAFEPVREGEKGKGKQENAGLRSKRMNKCVRPALFHVDEEWEGDRRSTCTVVDTSKKFEKKEER